MNKTVLCGLLPIILLAGTTATANEGRSFGGWYTGISVGESSTSNKMQVNSSFNDLAAGVSFTDAFSARGQLNKNSLTGSLFAGYGYNCWDPVYLGAELFVKWANGKSGFSSASTITNNNALNVLDTVNVSAKVKGLEYGVDVRPGFMLLPHTMLYGRVGVGFNKIAVRANFTTLDPTINANLAGALSQSKSKNVASLRLGAGLEQHLCGEWSIRADYIYSNYGKVTSTKVTQFTNPAGAVLTQSNKVSARLSNHSVTLGVSRFW